MSEYYTEALVLDAEDLGNSNALIHLYAQKLGKIKVKAVGIKKITSKLAGHFQPLNFVNTRIVDGGNFVLADGLSFWHPERVSAKFVLAALGAAKILKKAAAEHQPDQVVWHFIKEIFMSGDENKVGNTKMILKALGFEKYSENCAFCRRGESSVFSFADAQFICNACTQNLNLSENEVQLL